MAVNSKVCAISDSNFLGVFYQDIPQAIGLRTIGLFPTGIYIVPIIPPTNHFSVYIDEVIGIRAVYKKAILEVKIFWYWTLPQTSTQLRVAGRNLCCSFNLLAFDGGGPGSLDRFVFCAIGTLCSSGATEQLHSKPKQSNAHIRRRQVFLYTNFHPLKSFHLGFIFLMRPYQKTTDWRFQEYRISKRTEQINTVPIDIINRVSKIQQAGQTVSAPIPISLQSSININNQTILSQHKIFKFLREISCLFSNLKKCYNFLPDGFLLWNCPHKQSEVPTA